MPSFVPPKKNTEYITYILLVSQANTKLFQVNPTLAAGDVKVSTDGGTKNNIATLPAVTPGGSDQVKITLSAAEMNGDNVVVTFSDVTGDEWCDVSLTIQTTDTQIDNLTRSTTPANTLDIALTGEAGIDFDNTKGSHPTVPTVTNVTNDVGITQPAADKVWGSPTRTLTSGGGLTSQQTRDSMKLAPTAGAPAGGSVDEHLDDIQAITDNHPTDLESEINFIKGALGFNAVLDDFTYDGNGKATGGTLYIYNSRANALINGQSAATGLIFKQAMSAVIISGNTTKLTRTDEVVS